MPLSTFAEDPGRLKLAFFLTGLAVMSGVESIISARSWVRARVKRLTFHVTLAVMNSIFLRLTVAAPLLAWADHVAARGWGASRLLGLSGAVEILASIVVLDLFDYWWHRWNHVIPVLWRFHKVHHADTDVDLSTSLRFHPGELIISGGIKACWIALWGPSALAFILFEAGISMAAQFHHSNIELKGGERFIRRFFMTPWLHASHHTVSLRTRDANFSTIFVAWDHLFGTFAEPDRAELKSLGLSRGRDGTLSFSALLSGPFTKDY